MHKITKAHIIAQLLLLGGLIGCETPKPSQHDTGDFVSESEVGKVHDPRGIVPDGATPPKLIKFITPRYPQEIAAEEIHGIVVVEFIVETDGRVREAVIVESPDEQLSDLVISAVLESIFEPGHSKDGVLARVKLRWPITFGIKGPEA